MSQSREELIKYLRDICDIGNSYRSLSREEVADLIIKDRLRVVEPLIELDWKSAGAITIKKAIDQTLKNAGLDQPA